MKRFFTDENVNNLLVCSLVVFLSAGLYRSLMWISQALEREAFATEYERAVEWAQVDPRIAAQLRSELADGRLTQSGFYRLSKLYDTRLKRSQDAAKEEDLRVAKAAALRWRTASLP